MAARGTPDRPDEPVALTPAQEEMALVVRVLAEAALSATRTDAILRQHKHAPGAREKLLQAINELAARAPA